MTNGANETTAAAGLRASYIQLLKGALTMTLWDAGDGSQAMPGPQGLRNKAKELIKGLGGKREAAAPAASALRS